MAFGKKTDDVFGEGVYVVQWGHVVGNMFQCQQDEYDHAGNMKATFFSNRVVLIEAEF